MTRPRAGVVALLGLVLFGILATANSGGYRYGVSDQAFYVPAAVLVMTPDAFPKDQPLVTSQARLLTADEVIGWLAGTFDIPLPTLFLAGYLMTLCALFAGGTALARALHFSPWGTAAFLLLLTFRHRIARTGANSLEGYFHPRMLAFAIGLGALAALVRGRPAWAIACVVAAAMVHPTTAFWFGIVVVAGLAVSRPEWRGRLALAAGLGAAAALWVVFYGPLAGRLVQMDAMWLGVLAGKDYLFPTEWPAYAWLLNLLYPVVIVGLYRRRKRLGAAAPGERALVAGLLVLTAVFLVSVPFTAMRLALAVELQTTRVLWVLDVVAVAYLAWWMTANRRDRTASGFAWRPAAIIGILLLASAGRGLFLLTIEAPERQLVTVDLADSRWHDAMAWLRTQPDDWHVLADPDHAWKYGTSVRVSARRDVLLETQKDSAIAMYDRSVAARVAERIEAVGSWNQLDLAALRRLDARYDLDVAVLEAGRPLDLPVLYRNGQFIIYDLR